MPRQYPSSGIPSDQYPDGCGVLCHLIGCLFCFAKMKPGSRVMLTWFWLVIGAVIGGSLVSNTYFSSTSWTLHISDMRLIDQTSTYWCSNIEVRSKLRVDVYRLTEKPSISTDVMSKKSYKFDSLKTLHGNEYEHWEFYLLKYSEVYMYACNYEGYRKHGTMLVFQGEGNYTKWKHDPSCTDCYAGRSAITCPDRADTFGIKFTASVTDQYFFVVYNEKRQTPVKVRLGFHLIRTEYSLSSQAGIYRTPCQVPFEDEDSPTYLVVNFPVTKNTHASADTSTLVEAKCNPMYYVFVPVFVLTPLCIGLIITWVILTRARTRRSVSAHRDNGSSVFTISRAGAGADQINSASFVMAPPSYDECCDTPPTYEEVLRAKSTETETET